MSSRASYVDGDTDGVCVGGGEGGGECACVCV